MHPAKIAMEPLLHNSTQQLYPSAFNSPSSA
jgi:hypothetical protein